MSHHLSGGPLAEPTYGDLTTLTRSLHFPDFGSCHSQKKMIARRISAGKRRVRPEVDEVLWFGPSLASTSEHNWYGNVSFIISMDRLISRFGPNLYYLDKQEFATHTASRVILSKRTLTLTRVDINTDGAPIKKKFSVYYRSVWSHASNCKSGLYGKVLPHKLEIGIEVTDEDCEWIYREANIVANDHQMANKSGIGFGTKTCHRYNTFDALCPYSLDKEEADQKLKTEYPNKLC